ncbi:GRIP and coiled-coil domain-containing protein 2 isoform X3 [Hydra vulgaris]|uniref:GRIP and coiled-coil domain-containing protein 2 isoform X3 n=1 Tax=Hydra vulgaris TaxID=6087 RepID=UPI001F5ED0E3|nr:GRIP and coiled-coil domain-containing protein 2-like isoform X3 [Hydra vulgaris]
MENAATPSKIAVKLESLPKEELLKFIKKQALNAKELKKKIDELNEELAIEASENARLQEEKKDWLKHEISLEFEKKNKFLSKDNELQLAAKLGKEMLAENDDLHGEIEEMQREHEEVIQNFEDEIDKLQFEKEKMAETIKNLEIECSTLHKDAMQYREELTLVKNKWISEKEAQDLKETIKNLEKELAASISNSKMQQLKTKYDDLENTNVQNKELKKKLSDENKVKSEHILAMDAEMKNLRKEIAVFQKEQLNHNNEIEKVLKENALLKESMKLSLTKIEEFDGEVQKLKLEKEKLSKSIKSTKTKLERASQMEEELKKQLNIIVGERDELLKKQQKLVQKLKAKVKSTTEDELYKEQLKDFSKQIEELTKENVAFKLSNSDLIKVNEDLSEKLKSLQSDCIKVNTELEKQLTSKNKQEEEMKTLKSKQDEEIKILKKEQKNGLINFNKLQEKFDDLLIERESLQAQVSQLSDDIKKQKASLQTRKKERKPSAASKETQYFIVDEESASTILRLETRIEELLYQLQTLNEEKLNQETQLEELFKSHDDLQNKYDFECKEREKKEKDIVCLEERLEQYEKEINNCDAESNFKLHQQIVQLTSDVSNLQSEIKKYQQEVLVKEEYIIQVRNEYEAVSKKQAEILNQSVSRKEMDRVVENFHQLDVELMTAKCNLETSLQENNSLCLQLQELDKGFSAMKKEYEISSNEVQSLKLRLSELVEEKLVLIKNYELLKKKIEHHRVHNKISDIESFSQENTELLITKSTFENHAIESTQEHLIESTQEPLLESTQEPLLESTQVPLIESTQEPLIESTQEHQVFNDQTELKEISEEDLQKQTSVINTLQHEIDLISGKYDQLNNDYIQLKKENNELQTNYTEIQNMHQDIQLKNHELLDPLLQFQSLCEKLSCPGILELEAYVDSLEEKIHHIQSSNEESNKGLINEVVDNLRTQLERLNCKNFELEENISEIILKIKEKDNVILDLNLSVKSLEAETMRLVDENEKLTNNIECYNAEFKKEKQEILLEKQKLKELCDELNCRINENSIHIETLELEVNKYQTDFSALTEKYNLTIESLNKTLEQNDFLSKQCENLTMKLKEAEQLIDEFKIEAGSTQLTDKKCKNLEASLNQVETEILEKNNIIEELKSQLCIINKKLDEQTEVLSEKESLLLKTDNKLNFFESINAKLESENHELSEKLKSIYHKNDSLLNDLKTQQNISAELKASLDLLKENELSSEIKEKFVEEIKKLKEENKLLVEEIKKLKEENKLLSSEASKLNISFVSSEEELQSALNRIEELENGVKEKLENKAQLENVIRETNEKSNKFRNAAIKAKKDLEVAKVEFEKEKLRLEELIKTLNNDLRDMKNELVTQKTECSKHEEEFQLMQGEIKQLQDKLENEKQASEDHQSESKKLMLLLNQLTLTSTANEKEVARLQNLLAMSDKANYDLTVENEKAKTQTLEYEQLISLKQKIVDERDEEVNYLKKTVENLKKESDQINVMSLEMNDYLKTIESLEAKLKVKQEELLELQITYQALQGVKENLASDLDTMKSEKKKSDDQCKKLKNLVMKLKTELSDERKKLVEHETLHTQQNLKIEELMQNLDELKLLSAKFSADKNMLQVEFMTAIENHEKSYKLLEVKHSRLNNDIISLQHKYDELQQEYESYKVRAHNVLKQQKNKQNDIEKEKQMNERADIEQKISVLEEKLLEKENLLNRIQMDCERLYVEKDSLQTQHQQAVQENSKIESVWRKRNAQLSDELNAKILNHEKEILFLKEANESVLNSLKEEIFFKSNELEKYMKEIDSLKEQIKQSQVLKLDQAPPLKRKESDTKSELVSLDFPKSVLERQEGEGMDSQELEMITLKGSFPQSPISPLSSHLLENILSSEVTVTPPTSPGGLREEILSLRTLMNSQIKKNEHVTVLLRESEANSSRLDDQVKLLKDEIRRLERNVEREQALSNLEYLKNVIIKFLKVGSMEREQLIPVLCTMLKLSNEEKQFLLEYAKGAESDSGGQGNTWTNYMYRWAGVS